MLPLQQRQSVRVMEAGGNYSTAVVPVIDWLKRCTSEVANVCASGMDVFVSGSAKKSTLGTGTLGFGKGIGEGQRQLASILRSLVSARVSIRKKIAAGYAISAGVAIFGTTVGLVIGDHYQKQAIAQLTRIHQQEHLLHGLHTTLLQARSHASRFPAVLGNAVWLRYETDGFADSINQARQLVADAQSLVNDPRNRTADTKDLQDLLKAYAITVNAYGNINPINFIYGNLYHTHDYIRDLLTLLQLYQQEYPEPSTVIQNQLEAIDFEFLAEDLPKMLSSMRGGADRIRDIVQSLRNFSRLDEAEMKPVNLHEGIDNTLLILSSRLKRGIEVIKEYGELPLVECYPAQLNQVFMNLLCNAIDALEELKVQRSNLQLANLPTYNRQPATQTNLQSAVFCIQIRTELLNPNYVVIRISDNGSGIPAAIKDRIFDLFFTTKQSGKGTGLGLAVSYQIIHQHQGKVIMNSAPSHGTEFIITLPVKVQVANRPN